MKKSLVLILVMSLLFLACNKKNDSCEYDPCSFKAPDSEIQTLKAYIDANAIVATQHCSGVFYNIQTQGTGNSPTPCSTISFKYKGYLTNGIVFDQSATPVTFSLGALIIGWRNVLPLLKAGGRILLYVPPTLGYGPQVNGPIPANSNLIFEIDLVGA